MTVRLCNTKDLHKKWKGMFTYFVRQQMPWLVSEALLDKNFLIVPIYTHFKWSILLEAVSFELFFLTSAVAKQEHMNQMLMNQMQNLASMVQGGGGPGGFSGQGGYGE